MATRRKKSLADEFIRPLNTMMLKTEAVARGAKGIPIEQTDLREESLRHLQERGTVHPSLPVTLNVYIDRIHIADGRHRIWLARRRGEHTIKGVINGYGPLGGQRWIYKGIFPI